MVSLNNPWIRRIGLGVFGLGSALSLAQSVQANGNWVHLDVHRHCQTAIRAGDQWHGLQFTSNGWHHYEHHGRHYCGVMAQQINVRNHNIGGGVGGNIGGGINGINNSVSGGINGNISIDRGRTFVELGPNQRHNLNVWYDRACQRQGGNGRYRVDGGTVWCQR